VLGVLGGVERLRRDDEAQAARVAVDVLGGLLLLELDVQRAAEALAVHGDAAVARHVLLEDDALGGAPQSLVAHVFASVERVQHRLAVVRVDVERFGVHRHFVHARVKHLSRTHSKTNSGMDMERDRGTGVIFLRRSKVKVLFSCARSLDNEILQVRV
jgi:hypothetical protein